MEKIQIKIQDFKSRRLLYTANSVLVVREQNSLQGRENQCCECYFLSEITVGTLSQVELDDHVKIV